MSLVAKYERSLHKTLAKVYPEFQWQPWKFPVVSGRIWDSLDTQRDYFDWLGEQLGIRTHEEWYKVTLDDCRRYKGNSLLSLYQNSVIKALSHVYPEIQWQERSTAVLKNPGFWSIPSNQVHSLIHSSFIHSVTNSCSLKMQCFEILPYVRIFAVEIRHFTTDTKDTLHCNVGSVEY
jgi:hypothetical protein